jgi:hypothetical protein
MKKGLEKNFSASYTKLVKPGNIIYVSNLLNETNIAVLEKRITRIIFLKL